MLKNSSFLVDVAPKVALEHNFIIFSKNKRLSFPLYYQAFFDFISFYFWELSTPTLTFFINMLILTWFLFIF